MNRRQQLRDEARHARQALTDRPQRSHRISQRLFATPEFAAARSVLFYVDVRTEVQTKTALAAAAALGKRIAVPFCVEDRLQLFQWQSESDLAPGTFGILEPRLELRQEIGRNVLPSEIDLVLVPGLVFDLTGERLGYGRGFYDRLLAELTDTTVRIGLAFDCQVLETLPREEHDQPVDWLVTESRTIRCR